MKNLFSTALLLFITLVKSDTECPFVNTHNDRRTNKNSLRLIQYNVEWLFVDYCSSSDCPGNGCPWKNQSDANIHFDRIVSTIKNLEPDVINLCEIEGCDEINMLVNSLDTSYMGYLKKGTDSSTGQNVGLLTKIDPNVNLYRSEMRYDYPIFGSKCGYYGSGSTGLSKHYITEFKINGMDVALISAHLIAIPTDPARCAQREAQASIIQSLVYNYILKGYEIIVMGDFNDYDGEVLDVNSNKPTSMVLQILKGMKGDLSGKYDLFNAAEFICQDERYSDWWDSDKNCNTMSIKDYSMIDHILTTDTIGKYIEDVFIYHGYEEYCGKYDSDHFPVVIDFKF